jgi:hypothetical protein
VLPSCISSLFDFGLTFGLHGHLDMKLDDKGWAGMLEQNELLFPQYFNGTLIEVSDILSHTNLESPFTK